MQIGMIGLGRMGSNMVRRLMNGGHTCVVYDRNVEAVQTLAAEGATGTSTVDQFISKLKPPRTVLVDGAGSGCGIVHFGTIRQTAAGRCCHRRWQLLLRGRHSAV